MRSQDSSFCFFLTNLNSFFSLFLSSENNKALDNYELNNIKYISIFIAFHCLQQRYEALEICNSKSRHADHRGYGGHVVDFLFELDDNFVLRGFEGMMLKTFFVGIGNKPKIWLHQAKVSVCIPDCQKKAISVFF